MLRQSSSRSHRSKKLRPSDSLQAFLLFAVGVWIVYQLTRSYGKQRVVAVETGSGEPARRWLGRKGFVDHAAGQASADDIVGVGGGSDIGRGAADSSDDRLSLSQADDGDDEQEADEDGGVYSDADDANGDGLAAEEDDDDRDLRSGNGSSEDELNTVHGESQRELNTSPLNATDTVQGGAVVILPNATGRAADCTALKHSTSSDDLPSHDRGTAGDVGNNLPGAENVNVKPINNGSARENPMNHHLQISSNSTAGSVAGRGVSN